MEKVSQETSSFNSTVVRDAPSNTANTHTNGTKSLDISLVEFFQAFRIDPAELIEFRAIAAKKCPPHLYKDWPTQNKPPQSRTLAPASYVNLTDAKDIIKGLREENTKRGVYWIVNAGGNEDVDIKRFVSAFAETDPPEGTDAEAFKQSELEKPRPLPVSAQMLTKKSVHDYWLIDGPCSREEWIIIQQGIIARFGSDPTISNESRVMRFPNTNHVSVDHVKDCLVYKPIELVTFEPTRKYTVTQLMEAFPCPEDGFIIAFDKLSQDKYKSRGIEPSAALTARVEEIKARRKQEAKQARQSKKSGAQAKATAPATNSKVTTLRELIERQRAGDTTLVDFPVEPDDYTDGEFTPAQIQLIEGTIQRQCWRVANTVNGRKHGTVWEAALIIGGLVKGEYADRERCKELLLEAAGIAGRNDANFDVNHTSHTIDEAFGKARETTIDELQERTWIDETPQSDVEFYAAYTQNPVPLAREVWDAMEKAEREHPRIFWYSDVLSRLTLNKAAFKIEALTPDTMAYRLAYLGRWFTLKPSKVEGEEPKKVFQPPPNFIVKHLLAAPSGDTTIPHLKRITDIPVFDPEGNLIDKEGFHQESGIYYNPAFYIEPIPEKVTRGDVEAAKKLITEELLLNDRVKGFPFSTLSDQHNAIACLLTPFVREMITGPTPMFLAEASLPRSGKGLLIESILQVAVGGKEGYEMLTYSPDHAEMSKRITSALIAAKSAVLIDNINHTIDSGELCSVLTSTHHSGRILGASKLANVEIKSLFTATANNPSMSQEIAGRVISIRLTPNTDRPEERTGFLHANLTEWIAENRPALVRACLILCKAWIQRGKPAPSAKARPILGRYESFIHVIGGILETLGFDSFMENRKAFTERADTERSSRSELAHLWFQKVDRLKIGMDGIERTKALKAGEILTAIGGKPDCLTLDPKYKDERTAFGYYLGKQHDIVAGYVGPETDADDSRWISAQYRIVKTGKKKGGSDTYQIELLDSYLEIPRPVDTTQQAAEEGSQEGTEPTDEGPNPSDFEEGPPVGSGFPQEEWDDRPNPHF